MINSNRFLCFNLAKEEYAIPLLSIKEVLGIPDVTPVPQTPKYFLGIMNLRGQVISVIDLRLKLGLEAQRTEETTAIILDLDGFNMGIIVDSVKSVIALDENQISEKPNLEGSKASDFISGVFRKDNQLILVLDIGMALSIDDKQMINKNQTHKAA